MDDFAGVKPDKDTEIAVRKLKFGKIACGVAVFCVATAVAASAQTFTTLVDFSGPPHPAFPAQLLQGIDGNFYGITFSGGKNGTSSAGGTFFRMTPAGKVTVFYNFCSLPNCADGSIPNGLIQAPDGKFYGTTAQGGASDATVCSNIGTGCGTFFEIGPALTTLYSFCSQPNCNDGFDPWGAPLAMGVNGNIYGTTKFGGNLGGDNNCEYGCGTIFDIRPTGTLSNLHVFCSTPTCAEGAEGDGLILAADGNFYGATLDSLSGDPGGTVYGISAGGDLKVLHAFDPEGNGDSSPTAPIQATDGNFYGAAAGGKYGEGFIYKMTPQGKLTSLYAFCALPNCTDGAGPNRVIQGSDGNFYGTTSNGGTVTASNCLPLGCGTLFQITPAGKLTTLHDFCSDQNCADGHTPLGTLIQATSGIFYGPVEYGGTSTTFCTSGCGTIFSLSMGLGPFVEANPNVGTVGQIVAILGNNLTGTSSVTFNGTPAKFKVESASHIEALVPAGATAGPIQVTTPGGVLSSNVDFQVRP